MNARTQIGNTSGALAMATIAVALAFLVGGVGRDRSAGAATFDVCASCAYTTIQAAVLAAGNGDTIRVAIGTYTGSMSEPGGTLPFTATVVITKDISLLGGFRADFGERDPETFLTTIDGELQPWSVVAVLGRRATVDGFTVINGRSPRGSGVWIGDWLGASAVVTVNNNTIAYNRTITHASASGEGAGILVTDGAVVAVTANRIVSNTIEANDGYGAGIAVHLGSTALISGNLIAYNIAPTTANGGGLNIYSSTVRLIGNTIEANGMAGIDIYDSPSVLIANNTIVSNTSTWHGGGIFAGRSALTITGNTIAYNAAGSGKRGGGLELWDRSSALISGNDIYANRADRGGGISARDNAIPIIDGNRIFSNTAETAAGGIQMLQSGGVIRNNEILSNTARTWAGGGMEIAVFSWPDVLSNTVAGNMAGTGGGIAVNWYNTVTLQGNHILSNTSTAGNGGGLFISDGSVVTAEQNEISGNTGFRNGGGVSIYTGDTRAILDRNSIVGNTADNGGGVSVSLAREFTITGNFIAANRAISLSGGILQGGGVRIDNWDWDRPSHGYIYNNSIVSNTTASGNSSNGAGLFFISNVRSLVLSNTIQYNVAGKLGGGIGLYAGASPTIRGNSVLSNTAQEVGSGVYVGAGPTPLIDGNLFAYNINQAAWKGGCLDLNSVSQPITVANNVIVYNASHGIVASGLVSNAILVNNTIASNKLGVFAWSSVITTVRNNIVVNNTEGGIVVGGGGQIGQMDHNDSWGNAGSNYPAAPPGAGNISSDPLFANPSALAYGLRPGSPAIDTGSLADAPAYDKDGISRPQGGGIDMGAYESVLFRAYLPTVLKGS
jgi:parallel beta-helix repeat protein